MSEQVYVKGCYSYMTSQKDRRLETGKGAVVLVGLRSGNDKEGHKMTMYTSVHTHRIYSINSEPPLSQAAVMAHYLYQMHHTNVRWQYQGKPRLEGSREGTHENNMPVQMVCRPKTVPQHQLILRNNLVN